MTKGALIFAFNNESIDYLSMAAWSAKNIHRHLGIPVCVVTDADSVPAVFDHVVRINRAPSSTLRSFSDLGQTVTWYNHDRVDAYAVSPWDQTLVLDADYVVASNFLLTPLQSNLDFFCFRSACDINNLDWSTNQLNRFGAYKIPMSWATVMMFRRCEHARWIFAHMEMIRDNWSHFNDIYGLRRSFYRNDFALSIALSLVSGHWPHAKSPDLAMINVLPEHNLAQIDSDRYELSWRDSMGRYRKTQLVDQDFHAMCKRHLETVIANPC